MNNQHFEYISIWQILLFVSCFLSVLFFLSLFFFVTFFHFGEVAKQKSKRKLLISYKYNSIVENWIGLNWEKQQPQHKCKDCGIELVLFLNFPVIPSISVWNRSWLYSVKSIDCRWVRSLIYLFDFFFTGLGISYVRIK